MDTAIENISYKYRAPLRYVLFFVAFLCLGGVASFFFAVITQWVFRAIILFFMIVAFSGGIAFLAVFLRNLSAQIIFSQDAVTLPYRIKKHPVVLDYSDICSIEEVNTNSRLLKIITKKDDYSYILDESWMRKGEFNEIKEMFKERI